MPDVVGKIPEFTTDETVASEGPVEEVKETPDEGTETETPAEPPAAEEPARVPSEPSVDAESLQRAVQGLQNERVKLLKEISELKGHRREIKQEQLNRVDERIDELKDLHPDDVAIIDRVLRSKGYVTKDEANGMFYEAVKQEELNKFLEEYPEYKPENDPNNLNWTALEREIGLYRRPSDPHQIREILMRAHRTVAIAKTPSDRSIQAKKRTVELASVGSGGNTARPSSHKSIDPEKRSILLQGGFTEEDIKAMEQRL